jgi:glycosyltransferase involved in cell wall biosynthesis
MAHMILIADDVFAQREWDLLRRIAIGLTTNGWRPVLIAPVGHGHTDDGLYADVLPYRPPRTLLGVHYSIRDIRARLDAVLADGGEPVLVHAFGIRSWSVAHGIASQLGLPLVIEVSVASWIPALSRLRAVPEAGPITFAAADPVLEAMLRDAGYRSTIRSTSWGVHPPDDPRSILSEDRAASIAMLGEPGRPEVARAAVIAICEAAETRELLVLIDADLCTSARLWPLARGRGLSPTLVPSDVRRDELLALADITMVTNDAGGADTSVLAALASGSAVIASNQCRMNMLSESSIAQSVTDDTSPGAWSEVLVSLLDAPDLARDLGGRGRRSISRTRLSSQHVGAVLDTYEWVLSRDAMPITQG